MVGLDRKPAVITMNKTPRVPEKSAFTLIELLVVIAIIGILMSLLFPAVNSAMNAAKKAQAKNDVTQIATAVTAYYTEYGKLPATGTPPTTTATLSAASNTIIGILMGTDIVNNPRQIVFMEVPTRKGTKSGLDTNSGNFVDPWGNTYQITLDYGYSNTITIPVGSDTSAGGTDSQTVRKTVGVFNIGPSSSTDSKTNTYYRWVVKSWN